MFEMGIRKAENRSISRVITNSGTWIAKAENKEAWLGTANSWLQEQKGTLPGANHTLLSDVCVCAYVLSVWILVFSGSLRLYTRKGSWGKGAKWWRRGGPKPVDRPYQYHPHILSWWGCYLEPFPWTVMVISLYSAQHQTSRSLKQPEKTSKWAFDSNLSVIWQNGRTCMMKITRDWGRGTGSGGRTKITLWLD